jgi:glutathione S-transferase
MMQLYWCPRTRSFTALWLMEETGKPYERVLTDISTGAQKQADYLAINPMGKVPALKDGDVTLAENAAICAYVAERYPDAKLTPPPGDPLRAKFLYWLFFLPGCIEPAMVQLSTKFEINPVAAGWGEAQRPFNVLDAALSKGPWLLGETFSAADVAMGSTSRSACSRWCPRARRSRPMSTAASRGRRSSAPRSSRRASPQIRRHARARRGHPRLAFRTPSRRGWPGQARP